MARAAEMPTRKPVKLPGPTVTATRSMRGEAALDRAMTRSSIGISASAWPRCMGSLSIESGRSDPLSSTQAEQASSAVSMARMRTGVSRGDRSHDDGAELLELETR